MMPPSGSGVAAVMPPSSRALELTQTLWPLVSLSKMGCSVETSSNMDLWGVSPKAGVFHCPPTIHPPFGVWSTQALTAC